MKIKNVLQWKVAAAALLLSNIACAQDNTPLTLPNGDFEAGNTSWTMREKVPMSSIVASAAHSGKMGLRVADEDAAAGSSALSAPLSITGGQGYKLHFWVKTTTANAAVVQFRYFDGQGKAMNSLTTRLPIKSTDNSWAEVLLADRTPQNAATLSVWIHSYPGAKATLDFDDFSLQQATDVELAQAPAAPAPVVNAPIVKEAVKAAPQIAEGGATPEEQVPVTNVVPEKTAKGAGKVRLSPPYIMIKADDLRSVNGRVHARWKKFADFIKERKIHASLGIISSSLEGDNPQYIGWIKEQQATGLFEFWNHGLVHEPWQENGKEVQEYKGTSYEVQKEHFARTQQLAREKLGAPFATFGAPGNASDENTAKVLSEDPDTKIWLYGNKDNPGGKLVLDRIYPVNIENPLFLPSLDKFIEGYNRYPQREYFVIQGHAAKWDDARFEQFTKIVDFLIAQKAIFVTPSEYAKIKSTKENETKLPAP